MVPQISDCSFIINIDQLRNGDFVNDGIHCLLHLFWFLTQIRIAIIVRAPPRSTFWEKWKSTGGIAFIVDHSKQTKKTHDTTLDTTYAPAVEILCYCADTHTKSIHTNYIFFQNLLINTQHSSFFITDCLHTPANILMINVRLTLMKQRFIHSYQFSDNNFIQMSNP